MVASWITDGHVSKPQVVYGTLGGGYGATVDADTRTYVDGTSGRRVWVHHARIEKLTPGTDYLYAVQHAGATPDAGTFRTAPAGRAPFTFTSFGDQATPEVTWTADGLAALDANSTPASKDIVAGVETIAPLFHLMNGDLCYANIDVDRVRTWNNFFTNNTARRGSGRGCRPPATTRSSGRTARSGSAHTRPTSRCVHRVRRRTVRSLVLLHRWFRPRDHPAERRLLPAGRR